MKFNYISYDENLFSQSVVTEIPKIYICDNSDNLRACREVYNKPFLEVESKFMLFSDFKAKLFPPDNLVLREEKRSVILYSLLTDLEKDELSIDSYFDSIEFSSQFFHFLEQLFEYQVKIDEVTTAELLRPWQNDKIELLMKIRKRYINWMEEKGYTDPVLMRSDRNLSLHFLEPYSEIVFVNILKFSSRDRELLNTIEKEGISVTHYLQTAPVDFNEEKLRLKSVTLPQTAPDNLKLYSAEDQLLQLVNVLENADENYPLIMTPTFDESDFELLEPGITSFDMQPTFKHTGIFRFLEGLYRLISTVEDYKGELLLKLDTLFRVCREKEFSSYYHLTAEDLKFLKSLIDDGYVYFSAEMVNGKNNFEFILSDIKMLTSFENLREFCSFLENLDIEFFDQGYFENKSTQYYDAVAELYSLEEMRPVSSWDSFFNDLSRGLFKLILSYFEFKKIDYFTGQDEPKIEVKNLFSAGHLRYQGIMIVNASEGLIPGSSSGEFLLTDKQRLDLGLPTERERRIREKYFFFRHILSSNRVTVFSIQNQDSNITISSFIEELCIHYGLDINDADIGPENYYSLVPEMFRISQEPNLYSDSVSSEKATFLPKERGDIGKEFSLSYYRYAALIDCRCRFYLEQIAGLIKERVDVEKELGYMLIGILGHQIFEEVIRVQGISLNTDRKMIKNTVKDILDRYYLKFDHDYKNYYYRVMLNQIVNSLQYFISELQRKTGKKIDQILLEWTPEEKLHFLKEEHTEFYLNGRLDMILKNEDNYFIVDFKTGGFDSAQLDFYNLLISYCFDDMVQLEQGVYHILDERLEWKEPDSIQDFSSKIKEELKNFIESEAYSMNVKSRCRRCIYLDICRVEKQI